MVTRKPLDRVQDGTAERLTRWNLLCGRLSSSESRRVRRGRPSGWGAGKWSPCRRGHTRQYSSRLVQVALILLYWAGIGFVGIRVHRRFRPRNQITILVVGNRAALGGGHHVAFQVAAWPARHKAGLARVVLAGRATWHGLRAAVNRLRNDYLLPRSGRHDRGHGRR